MIFYKSLDIRKKVVVNYQWKILIKEKNSVREKKSGKRVSAIKIAMTNNSGTYIRGKVKQKKRRSDRKT